MKGEGVEDTYGVDKNGKITKIDDQKYFDKDGNEVDKLIADGNNIKYKKNGDMKNSSIMVKDGVLDSGTKTREYKYPINKRGKIASVDYSIMATLFVYVYYTEQKLKKRRVRQRLQPLMLYACQL
jgi:hypothetical protein